MRNVTTHGSVLDGETHALVRAAIAVASGDTAALRERLVAALVAHVAPRDVDELMLQSMLNVGYALALQAFGVWREIVPTADPGEALSHDQWREWAERGARVCSHVYGRTFHKLLVNLRGMHPALEALVVVDAYGKLIGRDGLDLKRRELCTIAEIAVLDTPRQLHAHLRGALNTGSTPEEVDEVVALVEQDVDTAHALRVRELWEDVRRRNL
jgi:alkylhydroperoxidase/carboxymuconolactone decarboxylase family protein YurZ